MKRFEFSLEKMLDYKDQVLRDEKNRLAELRQKLDNLIQTLNSLRDEFARYNNELNEKTRKGVAPQEVFLRKSYLNALNDRIKMQTQQVKFAQIRVNDQMTVVVKVSQDISTLEKLKERQYEEYLLEESKELQLLIEEFVTNAALSG